uniref:Uncharacterized protein n=1 Tax=Triticum urartu TaxID=4572 RepID=A0A8R7U6K8_TRIUA
MILNQLIRILWLKHLQGPRRSVYEWTVNQQQSMIKANDMFLPGQMAFILQYGILFKISRVGVFVYLIM